MGTWWGHLWRQLVLLHHRRQQLKEKYRQNSITEDIAGIIQMGTPAYHKDSPNVLQPIIQAIVEHRIIDTVYHAQYRNETTERRVNPYFLVHVRCLRKGRD